MKSIFSALLVAFPLFTVFTMAANQDTTVLKEEHGKDCNSPDSMSIYLQNTGPNTIDLRVYMGQKNGKWAPFNYTGFEPGMKTVFFVCHSNNKYKIFERPAGTKTPFPPAE